MSGVYQEEIVKIVQQYGRQYRFMTYDLYSDIDKKMDPRYVPYQGIDFLCPGFAKCGTSSLHSAFKMLDGIYLPERKENHFFEWCDDVEDAEEILIENFFDNIKKGQKVGMIDPTYMYVPKRVHDLVGNNVKIIFLVRNPVEAAFSGFKMAARIGGDELYESYSKWDGLFSIEMFDEYLEKDAISYKFIDWIEQFERYYAKEKMKIVFLEELIKKPQVLINDLLDFIGTSERYEYKELPLKHQGNFVMADEEGYNAARIRREFFHADLGSRLQEVRRRKYENKSEKSAILEMCNQAQKVYDIKITMEQKRKTEAYFNSSVRRLESWLDRDLSTIWF